MVEVRLVSKPTFNAHQHNYRKITKIGADADDKFTSPTWIDVVDDAQTHASESVDLEAVGVEVATAPTTTPT